jgi:hypothetical protein
VWVGYLCRMCGENVYRVDRSAYGIFVRNLMFYLHIYRVAAVGGWCGVFLSPFCNPWRRCARSRCWYEVLQIVALFVTNVENYPLCWYEVLMILALSHRRISLLQSMYKLMMARFRGRNM